MFLILVESLVGVELSFLYRCDSIETSCTIAHRSFSSLDSFLAQQVGPVLLVKRSENVEELVIVQQVVLVSIMRVEELEDVFITDALDLYWRQRTVRDTNNLLFHITHYTDFLMLQDEHSTIRVNPFRKATSYEERLNWCAYYHKNYGVDVRSLRYPGLISYKSAPGGGTTDYAVEIFHEALEEKKYECFLRKDTYLPMMYMPDAIKATIDLMEAPAEKISVRTSYNLSGMSFSPKEIAAEIKKHIPEFTISYKPDYRQAIANSWPQSIDDTVARKDWGWKEEYDLSRMTKDMLDNL